MNEDDLMDFYAGLAMLGLLIKDPTGNIAMRSFEIAQEMLYESRQAKQRRFEDEISRTVG